MSQRFVKGYTNNHLTWVMVDATDFATPESALSAATKIKIYGKVKGATGVNFVASGAGSMTNDIEHVGASVLGIYTIALAKADLSDASNAWYDQYIISLSATGAAYQTIVVDGGIMESYLSATGSDILSAAVALSDAVSNAYSAAVVGTSRVLLVQSRLSDFTSATYPSDISDIRSMLAGISDILSQVVGDTVYISGVVSGLGAGQTASAIADKVWSDYGSKVGATPSQAYSVALRAASFASDAASGVTVLQSRLAGPAVTASDLASKVWAEKYTAASNVKASTFGSALRLSMSRISDIQSYLVVMSGALSDTYSAAVVAQVIGASDISDLRSAIAAGPAATITASDISDIVSAVWAAKYTVHSAASSFGSLLSDVSSRVALIQSTASDAASAAQQVNSRAALMQSTLSDIDSALSSQFVAQSSMDSDIYSAVSNINSVLTATRAEPAQGTPGATITALAKLDYLYKAWRNRTTQTATTYKLYNDDAITVDHKATFSDDGTTADRTEVATGP